MPRPPSSSLARRRPPPSSSSPSSPSPVSPPLWRTPSATNAYTTAATTSHGGGGAGSAAPLDFLCPGFGFFSRALPHRDPYFEALAWSLASQSYAGPPPPPPVPAPSAAQASSAPAPSPSPAVATFSAPPPPPPQPQKQPFDVRSWRPSSSTSSSSESFSPFPSTGRTLVAAGSTAMGRCVCGRVRQGCLRCRGASTSAAAAVAGKKVERIAGEKGGKGKGREVEGVEEGERIREVEGNGEQGRRAGLEETRETAAAADYSTSSSPSSRLATLLRLHAPSALPSIRGSSVPSPRRRDRRHPSHPLSKSRSAEEVDASLAALWEAAQDAPFVRALDDREKLDLVRAFSRLTRALPPPLAAQMTPDPLAPHPDPSVADEADRRLSLRARAAEHMLALLDAHALWPSSSSSSSSSEPSRLPATSSLHASAALLHLDALALFNPAALTEAILTPSEELALSHPETRTARRALDRLFRPPRSPLSPSTAGQRQNRASALVEDQKTALALLLEAYESAPAHLVPDGAEAVLHLVHSSPAALALLDPSSATSPKELGYTHVLRRRYGVLLGRLYPSPSRWVQDQETARREEVALHLVQYTARAGQPLEAQELWRVAETERARRAGEEAARGEVASPEEIVEDERRRLAALTALVEGLAVEKYFGDANGLARELEGLAGAVLEEGLVGVGVGAAPGEEADVELVAAAFRVLAKLASDQGRSSILERVLERLSGVRSSPSSSSSSSSPLEPTARRLRAHSSRHDITSAQSLFDRALSSPEYTAAPPAHQARLWAQLVLAHTRVNDVEAAVETLRDMVTRAADDDGGEGLTAPLSAVNAILYGYARRGDTKTAFGLFAQLVEGVFPRVRPDRGSWNALVLACAVAKDPSAAEGVVQEMKAVGVAPDLRTWTTLMSAYVENGQWTAAFAVWRFLDGQAAHSLLRPDTAAANVMLRACVLTAVPAERVLELFRNLVERGIRPNMQTYTLLIQSVCTAGLMDVAEELFLVLDGAERPPSSSSSARGLPSSFPLPVPMGPVRPDHFVFANLIGGYLHSGHPEKARAFLSEMRARGMAPTTTTMGIVLGARLRAHRERLQDYTSYGVRSVLEQTRRFLEDDLLPVRKKRQPVKVDRSLAHGKEAVALLSPVIRAFGKVKDRTAAMKVFEEALQLTEGAKDGEEEGSMAVELYTSFMDSLKHDNDPQEAASNVQVVWLRLYDLVSARYIRLRPNPTAPSSSPPSAAFKRVVDPAQSSILAVPLTILIETFDRAGWDVLLETTWRRLADQGFAFDASNWNALARYFARDLQLERAMWIVNNVLTVPIASGFGPSPSSPSPAPTDFLHELAGITRTAAVGRVPLRLRAFRNPERDRQRKQPLHLPSLLNASPASPPSPTPSHESDPASLDPPPMSDLLGSAFSDAYTARAATVWHPFGATLEVLDRALDTLTESGTARSLTLYREAVRKAKSRAAAAAAKSRAREGEREEEEDHGFRYERVVEREALDPAAAEPASLESGVEFRAELLRKYPRAAGAIEQWKTRYERWAQEREAYLERMRRLEL
ncbi:hypothetical protein JCM6882_006700 [Rhodosporidiobolus microsporus]